MSARPRPARTYINIPHKLEDEGALLIVAGDVTFAKHPFVENLRAVDERTHDDVDVDGLPDWALEDIEGALIAEAERIWRTPT